MTDQNQDHARQAAQDEADTANPNFKGTVVWFEWEEAYRDQRKTDGHQDPDGTPPGCPPWG